MPDFGKGWERKPVAYRGNIHPGYDFRCVVAFQNLAYDPAHPPKASD
jgi:hypothetical protein